MANSYIGAVVRVLRCGPNSHSNIRTNFTTRTLYFMQVDLDGRRRFKLGRIFYTAKTLGVKNNFIIIRCLKQGGNIFAKVKNFG